MNDTAKNGFAIHTSVELLWDDNEPFAKKPFRVQTMVNGTRLFTSHHETNQKAKAQAEKMHKAYLQTHGS